jgi:hypothetical protein
MGLFDFFKRTNKIKGSIGHFGLADWWTNTFTEQEREYIINTFKPLGDTSDSLTNGDIEWTSQSAVSLLGNLSQWFKKEHDKTIGFRLIKKAEELVTNSTDILDIHFLYLNKIQLYYRFRDDGENLSTAIVACKQQIEISPESKKAFKKEFKGEPLPSHTGFEQLAIIEEKRGNYNEVIEICKTALKEKWGGDWENRINRCNKKLLKQSGNGNS